MMFTNSYWCELFPDNTGLVSLYHPWGCDMAVQP
uniref:Uncharacterized protein n=1 Tax=Rhizophora mucronata TaxID=61149 RepID=A0A2P2PU46_RHIMU